MIILKMAVVLVSKSDIRDAGSTADFADSTVMTGKFSQFGDDRSDTLT